MSFQSKRNSMLNIDEWMDKCSGDEPDSIIYEPDYANDIASIRAKQKIPEIEAIYRDATDICTKIGLTPEAMHEELDGIDEYYTTCSVAVKKHFQDTYEKLCQYKQELLDQIQKMTSDLYLPAYVPEDNVTLIQHNKKLRMEFNKLNVVREKRMVKLQELRDKQARLCTVLGIKAPQIRLQTDIPTEDELSKLAHAIADLEKEERRRKEKYTLLKDMILKCTVALEYVPQTDFEQHMITGDHEPDYTDDHLLKMSELHSKLEAQFEKHQQKFERLKERLISLYDRLDVPQFERDAFLETHNICKPSVMDEMEVEVEQYEELKKQNIGKFIEKIKLELMLEYEKCFVSSEQQEAFFNLTKLSDASEELLALCEKELERLKKYLVENQEILDKFGKWRSMWKELIELEVKATDPNRFNNRGGQLLAEERKRKALQKNLPKVEKELIEMNAVYAAAKGEKFKVFDTNIDEFVAGCWDELNNAKEEEKRERKQAKSTPAKKPISVRNGPLAPAAIKRTPAKRPVGQNSRLLGALSLSEQEFEDMIGARPASAKRR